MFIPSYEKKADGYFTFGKKVTASANICINNDSLKSFWKGFCCQSCEPEITPCDELIFAVGEAQKPLLDGNQYAVNVEETGICVIGDSEKGLINGYITLLHQIKTRKITDKEAVFEIRCGTFKETPRIQNQMVHFCVFPETELWEIEKFIKLCAALKYSHIVLEFWGMLRYDCLKELGWNHAFTKKQIRPLIKTANELGVEIIPMFNHWGHAAASRVIHGKHVVLDQNPRLQPLFSDDGWNWNIQNPDTLCLLRKVREELTDLCENGKYFHLGCDEAYSFEVTPENYTVLTDYLNGISDELAKKGRQAIVWGDMLINKRSSFNPNNRYIASCESEELEQMILSDLNKNIVIADWQYNVKEAPVETALIFKDAGFDTILCPWDSTYSNKSVNPCVDTAVENGLFGIMHTTWNTLSWGMCDVARAAYKAWSDCENDNQLPNTFFATNTAKILRNVFPVNGDYEKAGWSKYQTAPITR